MTYEGSSRHFFLCVIMLVIVTLSLFMETFNSKHSKGFMKQTLDRTKISVNGPSSIVKRHILYHTFFLVCWYYPKTNFKKHFKYIIHTPIIRSGRDGIWLYCITNLLYLYTAVWYPRSCDFLGNLISLSNQISCVHINIVTADIEQASGWTTGNQQLDINKCCLFGVEHIRYWRIQIQSVTEDGTLKQLFHR